ncbi:DUF6636 domain-containing protein [Bradyrhizobium arachidis]|uniref:Uncharacterized protein n=1 Tax=Bradyrhizobium arachidis TaxID=858423 RepID=A0AAE7TFT1_9BRAD|nr:DUF6636 domain-containing protein [Bradyrhizobium arachidis]QOZ66026.1 hypothetical protein WN72_06130 [Bradyrhizobium arachidis]SFV05146.1 hypothetical protein SAMN05192541_111170 [Bradyrhizobium arachidis]
MIRPGTVFLMSILLGLPLGRAHAQDRPIGFLTPSRNIVCQFFADNGQENKQGLLRCDIMVTDTLPRRPSDCELDWGHAFEMSTKGSAGRICAGDSVMDASLPVLAYGEVWQRSGFTCRSEQTGVTCFNAMQHGFSLARAEQKVF